MFIILEIINLFQLSWAEKAIKGLSVRKSLILHKVNNLKTSNWLKSNELQPGCLSIEADFHHIRVEHKLFTCYVVKNLVYRFFFALLMLMTETV